MTVGGRLQKEIQKKIPDMGSSVELDDIARVYGKDRYQIISDIFSEMLGMTIHGYDVLTQKQFEKLLDTAGSVKYQFNNRLSYRNEKKELHYFESGEQHLDGTQNALLVLHHIAGEARHDIALAVAVVVAHGQAHGLMEHGVAQVAHHAGADDGNLDGGEVGEDVLEGIEHEDDARKE